ncbi:MAG: hypothetical protein AAGC57_14790 [Pseudomonadota bacterium]
MSVTESASTRAPRRLAQRRADAEASSVPLIVMLFLFLLLVPAAALFSVGPLVLSPLRIFLLIITIPVVLQFVMTIRLRAFDYLFLFSVFWYGITHALNYGIGKGVQFGGLYFVHTIGVYALVQISIKRAEQIEAAFRIVLIILLILLPIAAIESITQTRYVHATFSRLFGTAIEIQGDTRLGMLRAATVFAHPILFGLFCASTFAFLWYMRGPTALRFLRCLVAALCTFFSLSAGALIPLMMQIVLISVEWFTRGIKQRMMYAFWGMLSVYTFLEVAANSGAFGVMTRFLTLNAHTAYYRRWIWEHGIDDVMRNPIFGFVTENWTRPHWMTGSVDNHWLVLMMRMGILGMGAMALAIFLILRQMMSRPDEELPLVQARMRRAVLFSLVGIFVSGATVSFFDKMEPILAFYIGLAAVFARWEIAAGAETAGKGSGRRERLRRMTPSVAKETPVDETDAAPPTDGKPGRPGLRRRPRLASGPQVRSPSGGLRPRR